MTWLYITDWFSYQHARHHFNVYSGFTAAIPSVPPQTWISSERVLFNRILQYELKVDLIMVNSRIPPAWDKLSLSYLILAFFSCLHSCCALLERQKMNISHQHPQSYCAFNVYYLHWIIIMHYSIIIIIIVLVWAVVVFLYSYLCCTADVFLNSCLLFIVAKHNIHISCCFMIYGWFKVYRFLHILWDISYFYFIVYDGSNRADAVFWSILMCVCDWSFIS